MSTTQTTVLGRINSLLSEINGVKTAADKKASEMGMTGEGKKDPGGYQGKSTHPSAMEATNVQSAPWGARAKENEKDQKEDHPTGVDSTPEKPGGDDDRQMQVGTHKSPTGEDPKVEDDYRDGKKDDKREGDRGGTEGPFNAEKIKSSSFEEVKTAAYDKMNSILADLANGVTEESTDKQAGTSQATSQQPTTAQDAAWRKEAAQAVIEQTILDARLNADLVGDYITKYAYRIDELNKTAAEEGPMGGAMDGQGPPPPDAGGGMPPDAGGGMPPDAGGGPPDAGGGGQEGGLDELINALLQMGMTPEDIEKALQEHMGGAGGGAGGPPGAEGPPPDAAGAPPGAGAPPMGADMGKMGSARRGLNEDQIVLWKAASAAKNRFRSGNWNAMPVARGTKEANERAELQRYILEVCGYR